MIAQGQRLEAFIEEFSSVLDACEKKKNFPKSMTQSIFEKEIENGKSLLSKLNEAFFAEKGKVHLIDYSNEKLILVCLKALSLRYRLGRREGGLKSLKDVPNPEMFNLLKEKVTEWKEGYDLYLNKKINAKDEKKILELLKYADFVLTFIKNKKIQDDIFKLIFRDNFPIRILVKYFKTCLDLKQALMTMRIGFFNKYNIEMIRIEKSENKNSFQKDLLLKINGQFVSILDDGLDISLNGGSSYTWHQIKGIWELGKKYPQQMEFFQEAGMLLFKPQGLKYFENGVQTSHDVKAKNFWEKLPVFLKISREQLEENLKVTPTEALSCVVTVEASCLDPIYVKDAHGASTIYLALEDGSFQVFPFGKYAENFPQNEYENACFIGDTQKGELTYPDPSPFHSQRMHGVVPRLVSKEDALDLMTKYGKQLTYFQFAGNNCSADFQKIFEEKFGKVEEGGDIPNYFRQPLVDSKFFFPANLIFGTVDLFPSPLSRLLLHGVHLLCGSKREYVEKDEEGHEKRISLSGSEFGSTQELYVPGLLVHKVLTGEIKGVTWFGYD